MPKSAALIDDSLPLAREMASAGRWDWFARLVAMLPEALPPDQVLKIISEQPGGGQQAEALALAALDRGADPAMAIDGPQGIGHVLAYAAIHRRTKLVDRLLQDPRSAGWLAAPLGQWPLLHTLMQTQAPWALVEELVAHRLPIGPAQDGSAAWEHRLPSRYHPEESLVPMQRLGLLPSDHVAFAQGCDRCRRAANRAQLADVEHALGLVGKAAGIDLSEDQRYKKLISSLVGLPRIRSEHDFSLHVSDDTFEQLHTREGWLSSVDVEHPRGMAGPWSIAGAIAWSHVMQGPWAPASYSQREVSISELDLNPVLAPLGPDHPVWLQRLGKGKQNLSLLGLVTLHALERAAATSSGTRPSGKKVVPEFKGPWLHAGSTPSEELIKAAHGMLPHVGPYRRAELARQLFPVLLDVKVAERVAAHLRLPSLAQMPETSRLSLALSLVEYKQTIVSEGQQRVFWHLLCRAPEDQIKAWSTAKWRAIQDWALHHPEVVMSTWGTVPASLWSQLPKALNSGTPIPLGVDCTGSFGALACAHWTLLNGVLDRSQRPSASYQFVQTWAQMLTSWCDANPGQWTIEDRLTWLAAAFDRLGRCVPLEHTWDALRQHAQQGGGALMVSEFVRSQIEGGLCNPDTSKHMSSWEALSDAWCQDLKAGSRTHPATDFVQLGLTPCEGWGAKVLAVTQTKQRPEWEMMEALERAWQGTSIAPRVEARRQRLRT